MKTKGVIYDAGPCTGLACVKAGFTHVTLVQVGAERQRDFIDWSARELLPALREL